MSSSEKRNDATSDEILALANRYWHCDDVSRATGNSGDRDMWRPSKAKDTPAHPRRQLIVEGGGDVVYRGFLAWAPYLAYKAEQGDSFLQGSRANDIPANTVPVSCGAEGGTVCV